MMVNVTLLLLLTLAMVAGFPLAEPIVPPAAPGFGSAQLALAVEYRLTR